MEFRERFCASNCVLWRTETSYADLTRREADIAISLTMPKEGRIVGRKLLDYSLGLYAAPVYLDRASKIVEKGSGYFSAEKVT